MSIARIDGQVWADWWVRSSWRVQERLFGGGWLVRDPSGRVVARGERDEMIALGRRKAPAARRQEGVVILHGLGRTRFSMRPLSRALVDAGFAVADLSYPSLWRPLAAHAGQAWEAAEALMEDGAERVHFVGHSLGGLVSRQAIAGREASVGRLVTIGTPHRGAAVADFLGRFSFYCRIFGACGQTLSTGGVVSVPLPRVATAVIAGGTGGRGYNPWLKGDNDGLVQVAETRLDEEASFLLLPSYHSFLMAHSTAIATTLAFLRGLR